MCVGWQDTYIDEFINCRKSDLTISLPGTLGTESATAELRVAGQPVRDVRKFDEFPSLKVETYYGTILLPDAELFKFSDIELSSKKSNLEYESLQAVNLKLESEEATVSPPPPSPPLLPIRLHTHPPVQNPPLCPSGCAQWSPPSPLHCDDRRAALPCPALPCDGLQVRLTGPKANHIFMTTASGALYASGVEILNLTTRDPVTADLSANTPHTHPHRPRRLRLHCLHCLHRRLRLHCRLHCIASALPGGSPDAPLSVWPHGALGANRSVALSGSRRRWAASTPPPAPARSRSAWSAAV